MKPEDKERIRDLEAQLAEALRSKVHLQVELDKFATDNAEYRFKIDSQLAEARAEVERLDGLLNEIEEHPHLEDTIACLVTNTEHISRHAQGHRCCAEIAKKRHDK